MSSSLKKEFYLLEEEWKAATGKGWQERYGNYSIIPNLETFKHKIMKEEFA